MSGAELEFRPVVDEYDPLRYAPWVRELAKRNGAYVIRDIETGEVLYVGESHSERLYSTLTRHFQSWTGYQAGTLYTRYRIEVAVAALDGTAREVIAKQKELIRALSPVDNVHHREWAEADDPTSFDPSTFDHDSDDFRDDW